MKERERNVSCSWTDYLLMAHKIKSHMARSHQHSSMSRLHFNSYKHLTVSLKWEDTNQKVVLVYKDYYYFIYCFSLRKWPVFI